MASGREWTRFQSRIQDDLIDYECDTDLEPGSRMLTRNFKNVPNQKAGMIDYILLVFADPRSAPSYQYVKISTRIPIT